MAAGERLNKIVELKYSDNNYEGSSLLDEFKNKGYKTVNVVESRLDDIIKLSTSNALLKIDVQGYDLPVLKGCEGLFPKIEIIIVETHLLEAIEHCSKFKDVFFYLTEQGYSLFDIVGLTTRPLDQNLCFGDFVFIKENSKLREAKGWK